MVQIASAFDTPQPPGSIEFQIGSNGYYEIEETDGRRIAEGYASVSGIDYQNDEVVPEAFAAGAAEYMKKNPVILWDHIRRFPIGKVLKLEIVPGKGLWVRFEIFKGKDIVSPLEKKYPSKSGPIDFPKLKGDAKKEAFISAAKVADETWNMIKLGIARGLSVRGFVRKLWKRWVKELQRFTEVSLEVIIAEISVTPIQVHPGAVIRGVASMSKALEICKAMPAYFPNPPFEHGAEVMKLTPEQEAQLTPEQLKLYKQLMELKQGMIDAGSGFELPDAFVQEFKVIEKAIRIPEDGGDDNNATVTPPEATHPDLKQAIEKALIPYQQKIDELTGELGKLKGVKQPRIAHVSFEESTVGQPKPVTGPGGGDGSEIGIIEKALELLGNSADGRFQNGEGPYHGCSATTTTKFTMLRNRMRTDIPETEKLRIGGLTWTPKEKRFYDALLSGELDQYMPPKIQGYYS